MGFFLKEGGYYFTLSDKADLSIKGDIYSKGSWGLKSLFRYKQRYKYSGNFDLSYGNIINSEKGFPDYSVKKDFLLDGIINKMQKLIQHFNFLLI